MSCRRDRTRALLSLLAAAAFCAFVVEQAPHLVHHLFEPDEARPECPFATASEHHPGAPPAAAVSTAILPSAVPVPALPEPWLIDTARSPAAARAPPSVA